MRLALDTNVLVYAIDLAGGRRHDIALDLVERALDADCVLTLQSLSELFRILVTRMKFPPETARESVQQLRDSLPVVAADESCLVDAMDAVALHNWSFWDDAMMWATAKRAGCRILVSKDGQDGRTLGGVTIVNPFAGPSPLLDQALGG